MIILLIIFLIIVIASILSKIFPANIIRLVVIIIILGVPLFIIVFNQQIQQGKFFPPRLGEILHFFFPADDLYIPLDTMELTKEKTKYTFEIIHKYVGSYTVKISGEKKIFAEKLDHNLKLSLIIKREEHILCSNRLLKRRWFRGLKSNGFDFYGYHFPEDVPLGIPVKVIVSIEGNLDKFLDSYSPSEISISKTSDE